MNSVTLPSTPPPRVRATFPPPQGGLPPGLFTIPPPQVSYFVCKIEGQRVRDKLVCFC